MNESPDISSPCDSPAIHLQYPASTPSSSSVPSSPIEFPPTIPPSALSIGFVRDLIEVGQTGSNLSFHAFQFCTQHSFRLLRHCLDTPAELADTLFGGSSEMAETLRNVHTTVDAAEVIAMTSILLAYSAATIGLSAADVTLQIGGIQRSENSIWQQIRTALPSVRYSEYTPFIQRIAEMVLAFVAPIREIHPARLRQILVAYALLQQANRSPQIALSVNRSSTFVIPPDLVRCMGFAAAAYGHLAVNFLEFIPRGIYQSDVLPLLVPGVTQADIVSQAELVNPFCTAYILIWDHRDHHLVLSVRGSMNLNDVITDLTCHSVDCSGLFPHLSPPSPTSADEECIPEQDLECLAHEGFLRAACALDQLLREVVLECLQTHPNYSILLCGHSLGAGVASLLALIWSQQFHGVRCVCLGPPCVLNLSASRRVDSVITSVVLGDDFVPRLSVGSCYDLRDACLYLHSTQPSEMEQDAPPVVPPASPNDFEVFSPATQGTDQEPAGALESEETETADKTLAGFILSRTHYDLPTSSAVPALTSSSLYQYPLFPPPQEASPADSSEEDSIPAPSTLPIPPIELFEFSQFTPLQPTIDLNVAELEEQRQVALRSLSYVMERLQSRMTAPKLFPPGRIIHIVSREDWDARATLPRGDPRVLGGDQQSVAYLTEQEAFSSLQLSGNMFSCHLPTEYLNKLRQMFPLTT